MPTPQQVDRAIAEMKKLFANYEYFFQKNESPDWIQPLVDRGFFTDPPKPKQEKNGYRSFPLWPESQYLIRMAPKAPDLVAAVLNKLPQTENIYVHADIVQAAVALPGPLAADLARSEAKWIRSQIQLLWLLPDRYADLVVALAKAGQVDDAVRLARTVLDVLPDPRFSGTPADDLKFLVPHPVARMEQWDYEQAIKKIRPALQAADPAQTIKLFSDLLQTAVKLGEPPSEEEPAADHSYIWRPAIEEHAQNEPGADVRDVLIEAVRDATEELVRADPSQLPAVVKGLEARKRFIFTRIALHLLAIFGDHTVDVARRYVGDWSMLDEVCLRHEYVRLAQARFKDLSPEAADELLGHLRNPPDMANYARNVTAMIGRAPSEEEISRARLHWELEKLAALHGLLPKAWEKRYDELTVDLKPPKHPEFASYHEGGWVGPTSPKSAADVVAMPADELIAYLKNWKAPQGDPFADSEEGLGRQLSAAIAEDPEKFAEFADRFKVLDPTYVRSAVDGFDNAIRQKKSFPWEHVIELAEHVAAQPIEKDEPKEDGWMGERDPGWRWSRGSVANLLGEGFARQDAGAIPFEYRERAWAALLPTTNDPEPSPQHEAKYGGSNMDPLTLSLNTNRGKGMQAVARYALWVRRDNEKNHPERLADGFAGMPEVKEVLENHLDPANDASLAVRAVYGQWFPWFVLIDRSWAEAHVAAIFPEDSPALRDAAWETYLMNTPYDNVFEVLGSRYRAAVEELATAPEQTDRRHFVDPRQSVAEHLTLLYWRGRIGWDDKDSLIARLFAVAPEKIRVAALEYVGRALYNGGIIPSKDQIERLLELWRRRFEAFVADPVNHREEIGAFGWWFASKGKLDENWLMTELLRILEKGVPVDAAHLVIERLADLAPTRPKETIHTFHLMAGVQTEPGLLYGWNEPVRRLISAALASDDATARKEAETTIEELVARGYRDLGDLLS